MLLPSTVNDADHLLIEHSKSRNRIYIVSIADVQSASLLLLVPLIKRFHFLSTQNFSVPPRQHGGKVVSEHRSRTIQNESHWSNYNGQ